MYVQNIVNDDFLDENKLKFPVLWKKAAMWVKIFFSGKGGGYKLVADC